MRVFGVKVFEDFIMGTSPVYTSDAFRDLLGQPERFAIQIVADVLSGTLPTLTVQLEQSGDSRVWDGKDPTPEINTRALTPASTTSEWGFDAGVKPSLGFIRLRIALGGPATTARVKVYVCGRAKGSGGGAQLLASLPTVPTLTQGGLPNGSLGLPRGPATRSLPTLAMRPTSQSLRGRAPRRPI